MWPGDSTSPAAFPFATTSFAGIVLGSARTNAAFVCGFVAAGEVFALRVLFFAMTSSMHAPYMCSSRVGKHQKNRPGYSVVRQKSGRSEFCADAPHVQQRPTNSVANDKQSRASHPDEPLVHHEHRHERLSKRQHTGSLRDLDIPLLTHPKAL